MSTFERGFKAWAERTSVSIRKELSLLPHEPLDPRALASYMDIQLWTPHDVPDVTDDILDQLLKRDPWGWSAVSIVVGDHGIVIYNPRKSAGRRSSDIMHELAHFILDHQPATIILSEDGSLAMRTFDKKQEDEANWLAWALLLPRDALLWARQRRLTAAETAERYGVAQSLVTFRMNMSGVQAQFKARRRR